MELSSLNVSWQFILETWWALAGLIVCTAIDLFIFFWIYIDAEKREAGGIVWTATAFFSLFLLLVPGFVIPPFFIYGLFGGLLMPILVAIIYLIARSSVAKEIRCPVCHRVMDPCWDRCYYCQGERKAKLQPERAPAPPDKPSKVLGWLMVKEGKLAGKSFEINKTTTEIGRAKENDIVIDEPTVSRRHAKIIVKDKKMYLHDLGSRSGTLLHNNPIQSPTMLLDGDEIQMGRAILAFKKV